MTALYRRLLAERFADLPAQVQALHDVTYPVTWHGRADVQRGTSIGARIVAALFQLPPTGNDQPLSVTFTPHGEVEIWQRVFGDQRFVSTQSAVGSTLHEKVGPCTLKMSLQVDHQSLSLTLIGARLCGVPLPSVLRPRIRTCESERDGRYQFTVEAIVPIIGQLVRYQGWLQRLAP